MVREHIRAVIYYITLIILLLALWGIILFLPKQTERVYNCSIAEISPDFPTEVRNQCRKIRAEGFKNDTTR